MHLTLQSMLASQAMSLLLIASSFLKPFAEAIWGTLDHLHVVAETQTANVHGHYKPCQHLGGEYSLAIAVITAGGVRY